MTESAEAVPRVEPERSGNGFSQHEGAGDAPHLVAGIVRDAQSFVTSYGQLLQHDFKAEVRSLKVTVLAGSIAAYAIGAGLVLSAMAAGHLLAALTGWPLAGGLAIVGAAITLLGIVAIMAVAKRIRPAESRGSIDEIQKDRQ